MIMLDLRVISTSFLTVFKTLAGLNVNVLSICTAVFDIEQYSFVGVPLVP